MSVAPQPPAALVEAIRGADNILIATHSPMDGDGAGSGLALQRMLRSAGKQVRFVTEARVPRSYGFLPGFDEIEVLAEQGPPVCDLLIGLDAGDEDRLGRARSDLPEGIPVLNIDHHVSNKGYGDHAWIDAEAAAVGEQIAGLLPALGLPPDREAALCLLVSLMTDTGRFCYSNTTARTLAIASELVGLGADPDTIHLHLYASTPRDVLALQARAADALEFLLDGRIALLVVDDAFGAGLGVAREDIKDLIDLGTSIAGVVVSALVYGRPDGLSKVSLRSKDDRANVAAFAAARGGGGHIRASGYTSEEGPEATAAALRRDLEPLAVAATP